MVVSPFHRTGFLSEWPRNMHVTHPCAMLSASLLPFHPRQHLLRPAQPVVHTHLLELGLLERFEGLLGLAREGVEFAQAVISLSRDRSETRFIGQAIFITAFNK
jgi:hypothetical protein